MVNNASPLTGIARTAAPRAAGKTLPGVAEGGADFSTVLTNLMELFQSLFQGSIPSAPVPSAERSFEHDHSPDLVSSLPSPRSPGSSEDRKEPADPEAPEDVRSGLRRQIERKLEEFSAETDPASYDEIRRLVEGLQERGMVGEESGQPGTVVDDIMHRLADLKKYDGGGTSLPTDPSAPEPSAPVLNPDAVEPDPVPSAVASRTLEGSPSASAESSDSQGLPVPDVQDVVVETVSTEQVSSQPGQTPAPQEALAASLSAASAAVVAEGGEPEAVRSSSPAVRGTEPVGTVSKEGAGAAAGASTEVARPQGRTRVEFVERILRAAKLTQSQGQAKLRIVLQPPHLGNLKVQLNLRDHVLHGTITVDDGSTRDMVRSHLSSLRESLEQQGVRVGEFQVDVEQRFGQPSRESSADGHPRPASPRPVEPAPEWRAAEPFAGGVVTSMRSHRLQVIDLVA